jgi:DNA primase
VAPFTEDVLTAIRQATDLAELIGRYVPLKRSGKSFKGRCPFHQEKTPSFYVTPERGSWRCFGCDKGGNAFTFLMEREGVTFPEAVRQLARESGIALAQDDDPAAAERASRLTRLRDVMEWACRLFELGLRSKDGAPAREYLKRRGLKGETAVRFRLGFAPPGWQNLVDAARRDGVPEADVIDLGLVRRKEAQGGRAARMFDMFRDRVTFPICDTQGRVIAFGARTMGDDEPKYLNSPETPLFVKGQTVYALHLAKQEMLRTGDGAVMEGYTDVIMAHQCGWPVAVAGLGTALTREQAALISRYVKRLYLVYDGDAAGTRAAERNAPTFLPQDVETRVAVLPPGEDPCDTLLRAGLPALKECISSSREAFDHLLDVKRRTVDMTSVPAKAQALDDVLEALVPVENEVRRSEYVKHVAEQYSIHEDVVLNRLREIRAKSQRAERLRTPRAPDVHPEPPAAMPWVPDELPEAPEEPREAPAARPVLARASGPAPPTEAGLAMALLGRPDLCAEAAERLPVGALTHPMCRELIGMLLACYEETGETPAVDGMVGAIEDPALASFAAGLVATGTERDLERQGRDCMNRLAAQHEAQQLLAGQEILAEADAQRRELRSDEADALRQWVEFHRRRAVPAPGGGSRETRRTGTLSPPPDVL